MNGLIYWLFKNKKHKFLKLCQELNIEFCAYYYEEKNEIVDRENFFGIFTYQTIDALLENDEVLYPLDEDIILKMKPYEGTAMDIINRWRRSLSNDESYMSLKSVYYKYLTFWNDFILKNKIDFFMLTFEPHIPMTYIPFALCEIYKIPIVLLGMLPEIDGCKMNYCLKSNLKDLDQYFDKRYEENINYYDNTSEKIDLNSELEMYFEEYSNKNEKIKRVIWYNEKNNILEILKKYGERAVIYIKQERVKTLFIKIFYLINIRLFSKKILRYAEKIEEKPDYGRHYFMFFLHLQPECTTLPKGGVYVDQLLAIKLISNSLPQDYYLYVKEHPAYWMIKERLEGIQESRSKEFYMSISKLKNVKFIDHTANSLELMEHSLGVVTITGTAGFEALFKKKAVITFSDAIYSKYRFVYNVRTKKEVEWAINDIIKNPIRGSERDLRVFLKTLEPLVIPCGMDDKASQDNGMPPVSEEDMDLLIKKVTNFCHSNYKR